MPNNRVHLPTARRLARPSNGVELPVRRGTGLGESPAERNAAMAVNELGGGVVLTNDFSFAYPFVFTGIQQGQTLQDSNTIDQGSDFLVREIACTARFNSSTTPTGLTANAKLIRQPQIAGYAAGELIQADIGMLSVQVSQTNRPWYYDFIPLDQVSGDAANPYVLPTPIWISNKTTVNVSIRNNVPALTGQATPQIDVVYTLIGTYMSRKGA